MSNSEVPVEVVLFNAAGQQIDRKIISVPGEYTFSNLSPGRYTTRLNPPDGYRVSSPNPAHHVATENNGNTVGATVSLRNVLPTLSPDPSPSPSPAAQEPAPRLPIVAAIAGALSMTALGTPALLEDFAGALLRSNSGQPQQAQASQTSNSTIEGWTLDLSKRLGQCLTNNVRNLYAIPQVSNLIVLLNSEDGREQYEAQAQMRAYYTQFIQIRQTIKGCGIRLSAIADGTEDDSQPQQAQPQPNVRPSVMVMEPTADVRSAPNTNGAVLGLFSQGEVLPIDVDAFANLSEQQRSAITAGNGWYPVILPTGAKGYISSRYVNRLQ